MVGCTFTFQARTHQSYGDTKRIVQFKFLCLEHRYIVCVIMEATLRHHSLNAFDYENINNLICGSCRKTFCNQLPLMIQMLCAYIYIYRYIYVCVYIVYRNSKLGVTKQLRSKRMQQHCVRDPLVSQQCQLQKQLDWL